MNTVEKMAEYIYNSDLDYCKCCADNAACNERLNRLCEQHKGELDHIAPKPPKEWCVLNIIEFFKQGHKNAIPDSRKIKKEYKMKNYCESCKADCPLRNDVIFCEDCEELVTCEDYGVCMRGELVSRHDCYIPREYPEIRECEDGCKPPKQGSKSWEADDEKSAYMRPPEMVRVDF